ncbi:S41 family peptidase [Candidatus Peregrinibacteria bacterium]|jgi:carboxyl-terminal processing protease|nr:S41 family peptidase [Candidatus Peregrinibacteria bacterium]MBT4147698.1 S41 family peptidase [Candidatus Peregrinibacteria bacterium]MBT4366305.1 S41 family peptidase [Candidatus Peregrinibacteria bacterium]MBT4455826.1 S41 family peptidase [Candidatus Peregrinibacteria bacterium]
MKSLRNFIIGLLLIAGGGVIGWQATLQGWIPDGTSTVIVESPSEKNVDLGLMWAVWKILDTDYLKEEALDTDAMIYGAVRGLVDSLDDPYTVFMDPDETEQFSQSLEGQLEGIGAELTIEDGVLQIVTPLKNSPAEKAGLIPGDIIYKIGDEYAMDMSFFEAIMNIRGESGTPVTLSIIRESLEEPFDVTIIRAEIDIDSVTKEVLDDGIVYLSVNQFSDTTSDEFGNALSDLILEEPAGLIVDLRYNGGGYLDIAVEMLSYLLETGLPAVSIHERAVNNNEVLMTNGGPKLLDVPLVVLVNEGSASASEIVAGAIQDHERGIVMGVQSFGKGTVQEVEFLEDGSSIRLTIAEWHTPDGRAIQSVGLTPDIIVEVYEDDAENEYDRQLEEAKRYLEEL